MTEIAAWLLRFAAAGASIAAIVVAISMLLERRDRFVGLWLFRTALILCLTAPALALSPPLVTVREAPTIITETPREATPAAAPVAQADVQTALPARVPEWRLPAPSLATLLFVVWLAGLAFVLARRALAHRQLDQIYRTGQPFASPAGAPPCRLSAHAPGLVVYNCLSPRMIAPLDLPRWSADERAIAFAHEIQHVRRGDLAWSLIADIVRAFYWFFPPVHALVARHATATEAACDASALRDGGQPLAYASALVSLARRMRQDNASGLAMARKSDVRERVERLIGASRPSFAGSATALAAVTAATFGILLTGTAPALAQSAIDASPAHCACNDRPPFIAAWPVADLSRATLNHQAALIQLVQSGERDQRTAAARALGDWPTDTARAALRAAASDPDEAVRAEGISALAKRRDVASVVAALDDASCEVRAAAARAMQRLRPAEAQSRLIALTEDGACIVRLAAHEGLAGYQTRPSAEAVQRGLVDADQRVRAQAAATLSVIGNGEALEGLQTQLARDPNKHVRQAAADALGRLAPRGDDATVEVLVDALADENEHVRYAATAALGRVGDGRARIALTERLSDSNDAVREAAAEAIADIGARPAQANLAHSSAPGDKRVAMTIRGEEGQCRYTITLNNANQVLDANYQGRLEDCAAFAERVNRSRQTGAPFL